MKLLMRALVLVVMAGWSSDVDAAPAMPRIPNVPFAAPGGGVGVSCDGTSPCTVSITFTGTIVGSALVAVDSEPLMRGVERLEVRVQTSGDGHPINSRQAVLVVRRGTPAEPLVVVLGVNNDVLFHVPNEILAFSIPLDAPRWRLIAAVDRLLGKKQVKVAAAVRPPYVVAAR